MMRRVKDQRQLEYLICYVCLVRCTIETTLDRPCATTQSSKCISQYILHLIGIDSHIVPVLREEEDERGIMLFESGSFQIDHECRLGSLQSFEETYIRERRVRKLGRKLGRRLGRRLLSY
jgi:hypothetical protein